MTSGWSVVSRRRSKRAAPSLPSPRSSRIFRVERGERRHPRRPRDLHKHPGRIDVRRPRVHLRPPHRLQPPLHLVRHPAGLLRGHPDASRRRARSRPRARDAAGRAHRRRAAAPARRHPAPRRALRRRSHRPRRDQRRGRRLEASIRASTRSWISRRPGRASRRGTAGATSRRWRSATRSSSSSPIAPTTSGCARSSRERGLAKAGTKLLASTVFGRLSPKDLVAWVLEDRLPVRVQLQMHKIHLGSGCAGSLRAPSDAVFHRRQAVESSASLS